MIWHDFSHLALPIDSRRWKSGSVAGERETETWFHVFFVHLFLYLQICLILYCCIYISCIFCALIFVFANVFLISFLIFHVYFVHLFFLYLWMYFMYFLYIFINTGITSFNRPHLESFLTVRFWSLCEVAILGGTAIFIFCILFKQYLSKNMYRVFF